MLLRLSKSISPFETFVAASRIYFALKPERNGAKSSTVKVASFSADGNQDLLTGNIYYYDETLSMCDTWCFAEDGYTVIKSANTHEFDENGDCIYCDEIVKTVEKPLA